MKLVVLVLMLASAAFPLSAGQETSKGQDQSGATPKYKKKRAKVQRSTGTAATTTADQDVQAKPAGAPGSSTAAPAQNPANPADPTVPTTIQPAK